MNGPVPVTPFCAVCRKDATATWSRHERGGDDELHAVVNCHGATDTLKIARIESESAKRAGRAIWSAARMGKS